MVLATGGTWLGGRAVQAEHASAPSGVSTTSLRMSSLPPEVPPLPADLAGTGLYADFATRALARDVRPFSPQYPLWTDGARKRRWIRLPPGTTIDATDPDAWQFPVGTKLWKELSFGRTVETRYIERTADGFRFAAYVWSDDGRAATLAPPKGTTSSAEIAPGVHHSIPGRSDCLVCHGNGKTPVLGFSALQLSADRDPNAAHREEPAAGSLDLRALVEEGRLRGFSGGTSPRIAARSPTERAALGYLHGNCGSCHRDDGPLAPVGLVLASSIAAGHDDAIRSAVDRPSRIAPARRRVARRVAEESVLFDRVRSREPAVQMPPLGTQVVDDEGVALLAAWIGELP